MQITKNRLKQIIKEELIRMAELDPPTRETFATAVVDIREILRPLPRDIRAAVLAAFTASQK